jgi:hypothetical protein
VKRLSTMSETCPTCGQPVVSSALILPPTKARILELVRHRPGIGAETLRALIWADDPNGGPEDHKVIALAERAKGTTP